LGTTPSNVTIFEAIRQVREKFSEILRLQAGEINRLEQSLELLRNQHRETEDATHRLLEAVENAIADTGNVLAPSIQSLRCSIHHLMQAAYAEQVFEVLAGEAAQMNVRAVVFDVRGKAAWASSAGGFNSELSDQDLHSLVVPLNQENAFRQVVETSEALETNAERLGQDRNVLEELHPAPNARIWLVPIRSAESVTAIFYVECGESENPILADALKLLGEFAGAQLDRLTVFSRSFAGVAPAAREEQVETSEPGVVLPPETASFEAPPAAESPEVAASEPSLEIAPSALPAEVMAAPAPVETEEPPAAEPEPAALQIPDVVTLSEEGQKVHRDAQRFSKLLVSEIELYNKGKVVEGRKNRDLYQRLKKDIDRSRQTYEKRFGNTVVKPIDYFHEELVRALAENDPSLLGSDYPGPSV
jgi:hypothetical protein